MTDAVKTRSLRYAVEKCPPYKESILYYTVILYINDVYNSEVIIFEEAEKREYRTSSS